MFMFPEPPPIRYYITNVSRSYLSDGIFHHGKPSATHKHVAKQLKSVKRSLSDPVAPVQELDPRVLDELIKREKEGFVDPPGLDDGVVFETQRLMPKPKHARQSQNISFATFPRSQQYELSYIREMRSRNVKKIPVTMTKCPAKDEMDKTATNGNACDYLKPPFWWGGETARSAGFPVGDIKEYEQDSKKINEKLYMDHPKKHVPDVIHKTKSPEDGSTKEALDKTDAVKAVPMVDGKPTKDRSYIDECACSAEKLPIASVPRDVAWKEDARHKDKPFFDSDTRWQLVYEKIGFSGTDLERQRELRVLTKPFLHELHKWYTKNKPTKFAEPVKWKGKRPIPEMRFSHL